MKTDKIRAGKCRSHRRNRQPDIGIRRNRSRPVYLRLGGRNRGAAGRNRERHPGGRARVNREHEIRAHRGGFHVCFYAPGGEVAIQVERGRGVGLDAERTAHRQREPRHLRQALGPVDPVLPDRHIAIRRFVAVHIDSEPGDDHRLVDEIVGGDIHRHRAQRVGVVERGRIAGVIPRRRFHDPDRSFIEQQRQIPGQLRGRVAGDLAEFAAASARDHAQDVPYLRAGRQAAVRTGLVLVAGIGDLGRGARVGRVRLVADDHRVARLNRDARAATRSAFRSRGRSR